MILCVICLGALAPPAAAQLPGQSFEMVPEVTRATVGDPVAVRFRVRLDERDLLYDTIPQPVTVPPGVRIVSIERLRREPDRIYTGRARVAFYRPGRRAVPLFGLPFMRGVKGVTRATLTSDSAFVEIVPVAPAGNPPLKDIRELEPQHGPSPALVAGATAAAVAALLAGLFAWRRRARTAASPELPEAAPVRTLGPYHRALARLQQVERAGWPARGDVPRHYAAITDTLRRYLEEAYAIAALESTTAELMRALPPALGDADLRARCARLLGEADLVKFARARPDARAAEWFGADARALLDEWHGRSVD